MDDKMMNVKRFMIPEGELIHEIDYNHHRLTFEPHKGEIWVSAWVTMFEIATFYDSTGAVALPYYAATNELPMLPRVFIAVEPNDYTELVARGEKLIATLEDLSPKLDMILAIKQ